VLSLRGGAERNVWTGALHPWVTTSGWGVDPPFACTLLAPISFWPVSCACCVLLHRWPVWRGEGGALPATLLVGGACHPARHTMWDIRMLACPAHRCTL
jgi:hypothetical protein